MSLTDALRERVRERAGFACEYCSVTEIDSAGLLTIDHFQPQAQGGLDTFLNLISCCSRCNLYKADYCNRSANDLVLWNPRLEAAEMHFVTLTDGTLYALTQTGTFTLQRLRLNRPQLVAYRLKKQRQVEQAHLTARLNEIIALQEHFATQQTGLLEENHVLLVKLHQILQVLLLR